MICKHTFRRRGYCLILKKRGRTIGGLPLIPSENGLTKKWIFVPLLVWHPYHFSCLYRFFDRHSIASQGCGRYMRTVVDRSLNVCPRCLFFQKSSFLIFPLNLAGPDNQLLLKLLVLERAFPDWFFSLYLRIKRILGLLTKQSFNVQSKVGDLYFWFLF